LSSGLTIIDWGILAGYVLFMLALGVWSSLGQKESKDYFLGGGKMSSTLVGISLFATLISTISFLSVPGEMLGNGPVFLASFLTIPIAYVVVGYILIPVYMRQRVTSAYELLEARLGRSVRTLGALMFIALRVIWMSLLTYLSARALVTVMGVDTAYLPWVTTGVGLIAVTYSSVGGMRAVVITDTIQFCLLVLGALLTIALITWHLGGVGAWWPNGWADQWDAQPIASLDPTTRVTVVGMLISGLVWRIATAGGDQTAVQRFMSTEDAKAARRSYLITCIAGAITPVILGTVGLCLMAWYRVHPGLLLEGETLKSAADDLFPRFIASELPPGVTGLVLAGMFAAAMSSIDSGVNSITAVVTRDLLPGRSHPSRDDAGATDAATSRWGLVGTRLLAGGIGVAVVIGSIFTQYVPGNFFGMTQRSSNLLTTPIFALFVLALFVPFATTAGALVGAAYGVGTAVMIAFSDVLYGGPRLSFEWMGIASLTVNLLVAVVVSPFTSQQAPRARRVVIVVLALVMLAGIMYAPALWISFN